MLFGKLTSKWLFSCIVVTMTTISEAMLKRQQAKSSVGRVTKETKPVPDELKCSICSELMKEAVIIQCCGESFCDECELL